MRAALITLVLGLTPAVLSAQVLSPSGSPTPVPLDKFEEFVDHSLRSPTPYVYAAAGALLDQIGGFPKEWTGAEGFEKRTASHLGQGFTGDAIGHAAAAVLHHRVAYDMCACVGAIPRTGHALVRAFVSVKDDGGRAPNWSLWLSKYAAAGLANTWYPKSYTKGDTFWQATTAIGISAGLNALKEFSPELLRIAHLK